MAQRAKSHEAELIRHISATTSKIPRRSFALLLLEPLDWLIAHVSRRVLLWITAWGIFSSCENLHLYHRLRQSYQDFRLLHERPGHLFLKHETEDLASFLQLAMLNTPDGYLLTEYDYANVVFSHDDYMDFYCADAALTESIRSSLSG